jgi:hypothetical protein
MEQAESKPELHHTIAQNMEGNNNN